MLKFYSQHQCHAGHKHTDDMIRTEEQRLRTRALVHLDRALGSLTSASVELSRLGRKADYEAELDKVSKLIDALEVLCPHFVDEEEFDTVDRVVAQVREVSA